MEAYAPIRWCHSFFSYVVCVCVSSMLNVIMALFYDADVFNELKEHSKTTWIWREKIETKLKSQTYLLIDEFNFVSNSRVQ